MVTLRDVRRVAFVAQHLQRLDRLYLDGRCYVPADGPVTVYQGDGVECDLNDPPILRVIRCDGWRSAARLRVVAETPTPDPVTASPPVGGGAWLFLDANAKKELDTPTKP